MAPVGILLAAGRGRRFDPSGHRNKLLQPLAGGDAVVVASARALLAVVPNVIAVVRADDGGVAQVLRALGCDVTLCVNADDGMAASLVHAVRYSVLHSLPSHGWLIALGDMPHVRVATMQALLDALAGGAVIAAPVTGGRRGNPVAFSAACLPDLLALSGDEGARAILKRHPVTEVAVLDPGIFHDIDQPADL
ncbi:MAG: nucleotidyltransferase family protein [Massilia sp.]|nr:nucleotidyltransferase family protein [Massilia sp.]